MRKRTPTLVVLSTASAMLMVSAVAEQAAAQWPQWGGPNRDFTVEATGLADKWPEDGPRKLWHRELGDGYSTILVDDGLLYTMYRRDTDEFTIALDHKTGETVWEHKNPSPFTELMTNYGPGPHSTPLVAGNRLFSVGTNAVLHCFDKRAGKMLWKHDLPAEYGAPVPDFGYACSPVAYQNLVIVPVDRQRSDDEKRALQSGASKPPTPEGVEGQSLMAFDQATGEVRWKSQDFFVDYSSPLLVNFAGEDQLILLMRREIAGIDPANGELLWEIDVRPIPDENIPTPLWLGDGLIFCSAGYNSGSRVIKLTRQGDKTVPKQLWFSRKMRILHGNAVGVGDCLYGTSGTFGDFFFVCVDINTGRRRWIERGFAKSTLLHADGKLIILDEDGHLALATVSPEGISVHSKCRVATERWAWATPTLVGTTLYLRDRHNIMALDLGA